MSETAKEGPGDARHVVRLHLWLEAADGVSFGLGRLLLLEAIQTHGSLNAASDTLGMSYRAAWGKIKRSERLLGQALLQKRGGNRAGYVLTPFGQKLLEGYKAWFAAVERHAALEAARHLPLPTRGYGQDPPNARAGDIASDPADGPLPV